MAILATAAQTKYPHVHKAVVSTNFLPFKRASNHQQLVMLTDATTDQIGVLIQQNHETIREESLRICSTQIILAELFAVFKGVSDLLTGKSIAIFLGSEIELFIDKKAVLSFVSKGRANYFKELESLLYPTENSELGDFLTGFLFSSLLLFSVTRTRWFVRTTECPNVSWTTIQQTSRVSRGKKACQSFFPRCLIFHGYPIVARL